MRIAKKNQLHSVKIQQEQENCILMTLCFEYYRHRINNAIRICRTSGRMILQQRNYDGTIKSFQFFLRFFLNIIRQFCGCAKKGRASANAVSMKLLKRPSLYFHVIKYFLGTVIKTFGCSHRKMMTSNRESAE